MDGAFDTYWQQSAPSAEQVAHIANALQASLDPHISNDIRKQALEHLEQLKSQPDAPQYGFRLADDWEQDDAVRYYGLQLLEHAVRYKWPEYGDSHTLQLLTWVKCLAGSVREQDALYIRNKVAQLWVEAAKRCWGETDGWMDMDALLVTLWEKPVSEKGMVNKLLVLYVLETLSEDVMQSEDAVAGQRAEVLGMALNEIIVPEALYEEFHHQRQPRLQVRSGKEGWIARICGFFAECVKHATAGAEREVVRSMAFCATKALNALRPNMSWMSLKAAVEVNLVDCLILAFYTRGVALQTAATEVLYALLNRSYSQQWHSMYITLLHRALQPEHISILRQTFERSHTAPGEDDEKYNLQKKLSEVFAILADSVAMHPDLVKPELDIPAFFDLLILVLQSKSLLVSIPVLHSWTKLLPVQNAALTDLVFQALGTLVQTCSERLLRFESLPEDNDDEVVQFLNEDFDTVPERHAFLGNYRRYCVSIIQTITWKRPLEALSHVLGLMRQMLEEGPYTGGRGFNSETYSKDALSVLQFDAHYQVVSSALKGYSLWLTDVASVPPQESETYARLEQDKNNSTSSLQEWSYNMINVHTDDPEVAAQVLQVLVVILRTIKPDQAFILHVVQHLLTMRLYDNPAHVTFSEAVKAFENLRVIELQKLALAFSNELLEVYNELEPRIGVLVQKHSEDVRLVWGYKAFLFMIIHRATGIEHENRLARLQQMLKPIYDAWQDPIFGASLSSLQNFCESMGLGDLAGFYKQYRFAEIADWGAQQLDEAGQTRQANIKVKNDDIPLRMTKSMLAATTEKLKTGTEEFEVACALWNGLIPVILPNLLQMLRHAQAFHKMANWSHLPDELQMVVKRTLQDRFWQSGISNESKDEFYERISGSKTSYEGFASVVRGTMRHVREMGYHIIYLMTKFEEQFYGLSDLAEPLAGALFADAQSLSANHLHPLINLATGLVQRCPPHHRARFLPPLLVQLFSKLDAKISSEWEAIGQANQQNTGEEELSDEMRMESVLRALTYSMVTFVAFLLEYDKQMPQDQHQMNGHADTNQAVSHIVLSDPTVLEPLILFCTHALRMRDSRCCTTICRVLRIITPLFQTNQPPHPQVREFISTEVLKACITSINEPYFVDMQKDLASLIALILSLYTSKTTTPRDVLLSLPDMSMQRVDKTIGKVCKSQSERVQRALVLDLLEGVRGVSIYDAGKIPFGEMKVRQTQKKSVTQQKYVQAPQAPAVVNGNGDEAGLDGVADLFGQA